LIAVLEMRVVQIMTPWRAKLAVYALAFLLTTPVWLQVAREYRDLYQPYSGTVVSVGTDYFWFARMGNHYRNYIVLAASNGKQEKRYISRLTRFFPRVGAYVEKKKGFSELPKTPGQRSYSELVEEINRVKERRNSPSSSTAGPAPTQAAQP
jgi:hypothetical protein